MGLEPHPAPSAESRDSFLRRVQVHHVEFYSARVVDHLMERWPGARLVGHGRFKDVLDAGDGTVVRLYQERYQPAEDLENPAHIAASEELTPRERRRIGNVILEVVPKVAAGNERDAQHLQSVFLERGLEWVDGAPRNCGETLEEMPRLVILDGFLRRRPEVSGRAYLATGPDGPFIVAVSGHQRDPEKRYWRCDPARDGLRFREDPTLAAVFSASPHTTGIWLQFYDRAVTRRVLPAGWPHTVEVCSALARVGGAAQRAL